MDGLDATLKKLKPGVKPPPYPLKIATRPSKGSDQNETPLVERIEVLEELITNHIDSSKYFIIFDELDEDYKDIIVAERHKQYTSLLTSLFKAVQDIKSIFPAHQYKLHPVIFLRDDIYDILTDPDKTKWSDLKISLDWDNEKIKNLLAFRISRAMDPCGNILKFTNAWNEIFSNQIVNRHAILTHLRP